MSNQKTNKADVKKILEIKKLNAEIDGKKILNDLNLDVNVGETLAIMGPNGSGKSTLAKTIAGHPLIKYSGKILFVGKDIAKMSPDERAREGIFLSFQQPIEIPGITISNFIRTAMNSRRAKDKQLKIQEYVAILNKNLELLKIDKKMMSRNIHEGLSGGEKKKIEMLQLAMLEPKLAILDETDSGLDVDALRQVCIAINAIRQKDQNLTIIVITHYQKMLDYLTPDRICIMKEGTITKMGGKELMQQIEKKGYEGL
ncbi:MAG: Fe-S cluster assembly ATPase SufC [Candidatus Woesearchaeota archaeon]|jgi:Fe-S cluster assembly ATP-binding protein